MIETLVSYMKDNNYNVQLEHFDTDYRNYNALIIDDKIVLVMEFDKLEEINEYMVGIPMMVEYVLKSIYSKKNENVKLYNTSIPAFLWDLYIVAVHKLSTEESLDKQQINELEADKFIAKKIIIVYKEDDELFKEFIKNMYPNVYLDRLIEESSNDIALNSSFVNLNSEEKYQKTLSHILEKNVSVIHTEVLLECLNKMDGELFER